MFDRLSASVTMAPDWDLRRCVEEWTRQGIPGIGLTRAIVDQHGARDAVALIKGSGLVVTDYQQVTPYAIADPSTFDSTLDATLVQLDLAVELGAHCIYVLPGPRGELGWDEAGARLVEQTRRLLPALEERGLRLALEPLHPLRQDLTFLNGVRDVLDLVAAIDHPLVGYVFDTWHLWWQRDALALARESADRIWSVQVSDHKELTLRTLDRAVPGTGIGQVAQFLRAFREGGYEGYYELEVIAPENEEIGYEAALREAVRGFESTWDTSHKIFNS